MVANILYVVDWTVAAGFFFFRIMEEYTIYILAPFTYILVYSGEQSYSYLVTKLRN
jgi:hypothetical protein